MNTITEMGPSSQVSAVFIYLCLSLLVFLHLEMKPGLIDSNRTSCVPTGVCQTDVQKPALSYIIITEVKCI